MKNNESEQGIAQHIFPSSAYIYMYISISIYIYIYIYLSIYIYISEHKQNAHNDEWKQSSAFKTAFRNPAPRHKEVHWLHHRC